MIVMKFGGTSVGDASRIAGVARLSTAQAGPVAVVVSAMGGTTDTLLKAGRLAESGHFDTANAEIEAIRARHHAVVGDDAALRAVIDGMVDEASGLLRGVSLLREQTPRSRAALASFGERLSAPLVAAAIRALGRQSEAIDARDFVVTDDRHEEAAVDLPRSRENARALLLDKLAKGVIPVVTGFIGATPEGVTTLLGRGGSDYSGALLGAMLDADEIWIWTDVDGIQSADPRLVRDARTLEKVSYREAAEMSYFGAKVVHPKTMRPAAERGIPIVIRSTFDPSKPGTLISSATSDTPLGVKVVTAVRGQALVTIEGSGMVGLPGIARRILGAAEDADVNVVMISQASSEQTVSLVVSGVDAPRLVAALDRAFALEMKAGLLDPVRVVDGVSVVSIIGQGMAGSPGVSARLFGALGETGVNVLAIAQGASELSISAAILDRDAGKAVRSVHAAFGLTRVVDVFVLGAGRVAASFLRMLAATREELARSHRIELRLLGLASRKSAVIEPHGLNPLVAVERLATGEARPSDEALLARLDAERAGPLILIDLTAAELAPVHRAAVEHAFHVVTANKIPLSGPLEQYVGLVDAVRRTGALYGYETTFGAGLPVLHTLKEMLDTGDTVDSVSGCFSGTLGFLCTRLQDGVPLADAVREAEKLGYTEPDPRDDLSGKDVARKALIVARSIGLKLEPSDVARDPFVADLDDGLDVALARHGEAMSTRIREAAARGHVLRYVANITPGAVRVGLEEVPADSPIGSLRGPDNILVFRTARYRDYPLVVRGPGAGAEVTAAGVLGDVLRVASGV